MSSTHMYCCYLAIFIVSVVALVSSSIGVNILDQCPVVKEAKKSTYYFLIGLLVASVVGLVSSIALSSWKYYKGNGGSFSRPRYTMM